MASWFRIAVVAASVSVPGVVSAAAPAALAPLIGSWSGSGAVKLDNGQSEAVKCKAYYTERGSSVGVSLRCASSASKIDLRAQLDTAGGKVSGNWEERQFNAAGSLSGAVAGNRLSLNLEGGGLKAVAAVVTSGAAQTVSITSETAGFKSVSVALTRE